MSVFSDFIDGLRCNDQIESSLYYKYNVKRGLRNPDGSGILVGLTRVGDVHGYIVNENDKQACEGKLFYRGVDMEDIVKNAEMEHRFSFEETIFLLLLGYLPSKDELEKFQAIINSNRELPQGFAEDSIMKQPSRDIMNKLACSVLALYPYDSDPENLSVENVLRQCLELIARFPTMAAYCYRAKRHYFDNASLIIHKLKGDQQTAETILSLMRRDQQFTRLEAETLDIALTLHAEHGGGNNSTFAVHLVTSADTDTYSAIAAGLASLKGYKHGGANYKVISMMNDLKANVKDWSNEDQVSYHLEKIAKGTAHDGSGLIYGMGHAVYTISDPRAILLRERAARLAAEKNCEEEYHLYTLVEKLSPQIIKYVKNSTKDICANVDLYSGFVYKILDIPEELYTPIFAVSRLTGWCAHRIEEIISGGKIIRPAYKCVQPHLNYIPLDKRL